MRHHLAGIAAILFFGHAAAAATDPRVAGQTIVSESLPRVRVKVAPEIRYLGEHPIRIRDVAAGKRFVFAETTPDGKVRRMVIAQFEGFLPGIDDIYLYRFDGAPVLGGLPFRQNGFASSTRAELAENPGSEVEATMRFLADKRVSAPDGLAIYRFVTIGDDTRKNEMILFYMEPLEALGIADASKSLSPAALGKLAEHARGALTIEGYPAEKP